MVCFPQPWCVRSFSSRSEETCGVVFSEAGDPFLKLNYVGFFTVPLVPIVLRESVLQ